MPDLSARRGMRLGTGALIIGIPVAGCSSDDLPVLTPDGSLPVGETYLLEADTLDRGKELVIVEVLLSEDGNTLTATAADRRLSKGRRFRVAAWEPPRSCTQTD